VVGARIRGDHDSPLPALVTGQMREEPVGGRGCFFMTDAEVVTDLVRTAELRDRLASLLDCTEEHRGQPRCL
jgi:hypothetical protein